MGKPSDVAVGSDEDESVEDAQQIPAPAILLSANNKKIISPGSYHAVNTGGPADT